MPTLRVRLTEEQMHAVDLEAARRGITRSEVARQTLSVPRPAAGEVTLPEVLSLLGEQARAGVVAAQTALLRYHLQHREVGEKLVVAGDVGPGPLDEVDELARRRGFPT